MSVQVISFKCLLKNTAGQIISSTFNRDVLSVSTEKSPLLPGLARGLQNLKKGERREIKLAAEEAYGLYDPKKIILYPRRKLPKDILIGQTIGIAGKSGVIRNYRLLQFHDDMASLDGNHPLAGQDLIFEIEALDAREATEEEIEEALGEVAPVSLH